jgi:hypothetical protein
MKLTKFRSLLLVLLLSVIWTSQAQATCTRTGGAIQNTGAVVSDTNGDTMGCQEIPDNYKLTFYKLGICTADPFDLDLSSCAFMYDGAALAHTIATPATASLNTGSFTIPPGSYSYMVAIISSKLGISHEETFTDNLIGKTGTGTSCWSVSGMTSFTGEAMTHNVFGAIKATGTANKTIDCGTAAQSSPSFAYEVIDSFGDNCGGDLSVSMTHGAVSNGIAKAKLLKADNTLATACTNSSRILWRIGLTTPLTVIEGSGFDLGFKTTDAMSFDLDPTAGSSHVVKVGANAIEGILSVLD